MYLVEIIWSSWKVLSSQLSLWFIELVFFYSTGIFLSFNQFPFWPIESNNTR